MDWSTASIPQPAPRLRAEHQQMKVNPPAWSRWRTARCCRGSSWHSSGWRQPQPRKGSCTCRARRRAPSWCSPGDGSRRTGGSRRRLRTGSHSCSQSLTWKSNRSKSYWGLPTRKTAWRRIVDRYVSLASVVIRRVCDDNRPVSE